MKFNQFWRSARAQVGGRTEESILVDDPLLCKGTQTNCCPQQEFLLQDNINNTNKTYQNC
jgi:hypothetical protein